MAITDNKLFRTLQRLFSTDVIIRNVGGNQVKVMDVNQIQSTGVVQTNMYPDRYQRIYTGGLGTYIGNAPYSNFTVLRPQLYNDYEVMDGDPILASVLDIVADESTLKNNEGEILSIRSSDENIQRILYNLFYDVLNIEFNLWGWIRSMCKYGDHYLHLHIAEKYGIYQVIPLNVYNVVREEGLDPKNPSYVRFRVEPNASYNGVLGSTDRDCYFENYEIANFRLIGDYNFLPFGRSYLEPARKIFKQLCLMEDSMLIHRILRAPQRRIYYIDVGNIPPNEIPAYMEKIKSQTARTPYVDPSTGEYNLRYNITTVNEDFYIPTRGQNTGTKIDTLPGLEYNAIEDVVYLRDKMLAAIKVPKAFIGFEADIEGKCIDPLTKIPLLDGRTLTASELIEEHTQGIRNYVYSLDEKTHNIVPGEIEWAGFTRLNTPTIKVWLDNGEFIRCTSDHKFMTRDGKYKEAQYLTEGESLMPLYLKKSQEKKIQGYTEVYNPSIGEYEKVHRIIARHYGNIEKGKVVHHKDCNKLNNNPENLDCSMNFWEHRRWHIDHVMMCHTEEACRKRKETHNKLMLDPEYAEMRRDVCRENSKFLVEWIKEHGASRKGYIKYKQTECTGCGKIIDKTKLSLAERRSMYCSSECRKANWKKKSNQVEYNTLVEAARECRNFGQLMEKIGIKDHATLTHIFTHHGFKPQEFILKYMPCSHTNIHFMNQFPETNEYYIENYHPEHKEWKIKYSPKNHKVVKTEKCEDLIDTCDITVKDFHNFGTEAGVIIHNSTLSQQDIRFARTIERIQRIVVSELTKIALVHLYSQGYNDESLTNFELELTTPSIIYDQERIALMKEKTDLAEQMMNSNLFSSNYIYDSLFHMSEDKYDDLRDLIIEDKKRLFRLTQIENEGNDPVQSGKSYGTPHDLASLYGKGRNGMGDLPAEGYDETNPIGRPQEKTSVYGTQKRILGRDPLGKNMSLQPDSWKAPVPNGGSPLSLKEEIKPNKAKAVYIQHKEILGEMEKKINIFEDDNKGSSLLDENNVKGIE